MEFPKVVSPLKALLRSYRDGGDLLDTWDALASPSKIDAAGAAILQSTNESESCIRRYVTYTNAATSN